MVRAVGPGGFLTGDNLGGIVVELVPGDRRTVRTRDFIAAWRAEIRPLAGTRDVTIVPAQAGPPGRDVDVRLAGESVAALRAAADEVRALLAGYPGVHAVEDDLPYGKTETILQVSAHGRSLGFSTDTLGRQLRNAFQGAIAKRFPRGDEEVTVKVRFRRGAAAA